MLAAIFFIFTTILPGAAVLLFLKKQFLSRLRIAAIIFGLGSAIVTFELFIYFVILRFSYSFFVPWFLGLQAAAALIWLVIKIPWKKQYVIDFPRRGLWPWLIGILLAVLLFFSLIQALAKPPVAYDNIAFWASRAEILLKDKKVNFDPQSETYLSAYGHHNYPWHVSFLEYWIRSLGAVGGVVQLIAWLYFVSLLLLILDFSTKRLGTVKGMLLGLFFASQPFIFYHASNNYADLIIGYYVAVAFAFFFDWLETRNYAHLNFSVAFFAWTLCVKNYGIFYIIALLVGLAAVYLLKVERFSLKKLWPAGLAFVLPLAPYGLFKIFFRLNLHNTDASWGWHPEIFTPLLQVLFVSGNWNIWWPIIIVAALFALAKIKKDKTIGIAWFMAATVLAIIITIFIVTENYQWALDHTALSRAFIPVVPLTMLVIAFSFKSYGHSDIRS